MNAQKILIIRFSSIGDIVLTTPVIRCIKQQLPEAELHYVTKESFRSILSFNPYIDKLHCFQKDVAELYTVLAAERYDAVIDLHKNLRSLRLKRALRTRSFSFDKINLRKFFAVNFKMLSLLPEEHIVQRYLKAALPLGVHDDAKGLDYFTGPADEIDPATRFFNGKQVKYISLVVGGSYYTKKIPLNRLCEIAGKAVLPVVVLGGPEDKSIADELQKKHPGIINACGSLSVNQSASVVSRSEWVITGDTGMMHIAAAYDKKIISVWGNTIPEFGMGPYKPHPQNKVLEVNDLPCTPCSKLGYRQCPLGHFKCMNEIDYSAVSGLE